MGGEKLLDPTNRVKTCISNNASSQALMSRIDPELEAGSNGGSLRGYSSEESIAVGKTYVKSPNFVTRSEWITLAILTFVNLINYMDRYTIAGTYFHR